MRMLGFLTVVAAVALTGCAKPEGLHIVDPMVRLAANPKAPAAGYFTIKGGPVADRLLSVSSPLVIKIELHESMSKESPSTSSGGAMASMKPLDGGVEVPANGTVEFKEGGKHLMLYDINPGVAPNETIQVNFTFASGTILQGFAPVRRAGR